MPVSLAAVVACAVAFAAVVAFWGPTTRSDDSSSHNKPSLSVVKITVCYDLLIVLLLFCCRLL
jgi:site-specific recombinase